MASDPHGWPDPARPGVPLNPERTRQHWFDNPARPNDAPVLVWWFGEGRAAWWDRPVQAMGYRYLGPCLTPAEVAAREAAAEVRGWEKGRDAEREARSIALLNAALRDGPKTSPTA